MRVGILARNEMIKSGHRVAFWIGLAGFAALMSIIFGAMFYAGVVHGPSQAFALPRAWTEVLSGPGPLTSFFASITLILLVASEFSWRTARQNVIDGLSKEEFFLAKLLLLPVLALVFYGALLLIGGGLGLAGSRTLGAAGPLIRGVDLAYMGGALLGLLGWGSLAFMLAVTVRNSGPALGAFFLYFLAEQVLGQLLGRVSQTAATVAHYLPTSVFKELWDAQVYGAVASPPGRPPVVDSPALLAIGSAYLVAFVAMSFLLYRRRDL